MSSGFDPNAVLKTRPGQMKLAAAGVGFFAMVFCIAGHDHQEYLRAQFHGKSCGSNVEFHRCPAVWAGQLALALIIIAWLFSLAMLIIASLPSLSQNPQVRMADIFGHIGAGVVLIIAGFCSIWWPMSMYFALECDKGSEDSSRRWRRLSQKDCSDDVFTTICSLDGTVCAGQKGWLYIAAGVFALIFAGLCITVFVMLKKAPRGPMMMGGMMTQQPSQAPMSMHPSQMTQQQQQQQNPDQQSVHPSQMTQQQG